MKNIKLLIEYDGTDYHGWQTQKPEAILTIQDILQEKIKKITGENIKLIAAARTDAGVHALGQVASFKTNSHMEPLTIQRALNATLPEDIRIISVDVAEEAFHPRYSAISKTYFYLITNMNIASAFLYRYTWKVPYQLDLNVMKDAAKLLLGRHDFSAFRGAGCGAKNPIREITSMNIDRLNRIDFMTTQFKGNFIKIRIEANAFLRHMVRNIVGTLIEIGRGKMTLDSISEALEHGDRTKTGPTAPANGLFLEKIRY